LRDQIFKFKLRCFNILYYYCNIYNTKKFFIKFVKIVLIYNLQKKISYIIRKSQILKFVYIKNKSFKNLRISFLCKLRLYKDCFLIHSTRICVYIILILKFNVNSFCILIYAILLVRNVTKILLLTKLNIFVVVY